jgi:hypothetical protein
MKSKQTQPTKRTFSTNQLSILLLQEAFKRDLPLFRQLVTETSGFFGQPFVEKNWTFTVLISENGERELVVNVPQKKS